MKKTNEVRPVGATETGSRTLRLFADRLSTAACTKIEPVATAAVASFHSNGKFVGSDGGDASLSSWGLARSLSH